MQLEVRGHCEPQISVFDLARTPETLSFNLFQL